VEQALGLGPEQALGLGPEQALVQHRQVTPQPALLEPQL